jgi:hypothetical protein
VLKERSLAHLFWEVFIEHWNGLRSEEKEKWDQGSDVEWTEVMLGNSKANTEAEGGLLVECVREYLNKLLPDKDPLVRCEWDKIDLVGLTRYGEKNWYEASLQIMIEHENRVDATYDIESEFYKLLHWRAPLKVLVCYRKASELVNERYKEKQALFSRMYMEALQLMRADTAEYLMLVGGCEGENKTFSAFGMAAGKWQPLG